MKEGDKNTQFFHRFVKTHIARNKILRLLHDDGSWTKDYEEIKSLAVNFFQSLFTEPNIQESPSQNWKGKALTNEQANGLLTNITHKEIRDTFFLEK